MSCDKTIGPDGALQETIDALSAGGTLCLEPGTYRGTVRVDGKGLTIRPAGAAGAKSPVILDGDGRGPVVTLGPGAEARLEGLKITGGEAEQGAGITLLDEGKLVVSGCVLEGNRADANGGALWLHAGEVTIERTILRGNRARQGGAIAAVGFATVTVGDSLLTGNRAGRGSAIIAREASALTVTRATLVGNEGGPDVRVEGSSSQSPEARISGAIIGGGVEARPKSALRVERSLFLPEAQGFAAEGGNRQGDAALDDAHRPTASSPAVGLAKGGGVDLDGKPRGEVGACAGAYEPR